MGMFENADIPFRILSTNNITVNETLSRQKKLNKTRSYV